MSFPKFEEAVKHIFTNEELSDKKLDLVNMGAEKVVFKVEGIPDRVFKIPIDAFDQRTAFIIEGNKGDKKECDRTVIENQIIHWEEERELEEEATKIFGKEHFLERGIFRVTIPVTKPMLIKYLGEEKTKFIDDDFCEEVKMLAESQEVLDVLINPDDYLKIAFATYLITAEDFRPSPDCDINEGLSLIKNKIDEQLKLMKDMINDEYLGSVLREITEGMIKYTKQTGRMIDIFGRDNLVIFSRKDSINSEKDDITDYDYKFIEFSMTGDKDYWMTTFEEDIKDGLGFMRHHYSYYCFIAKLAKKLGIQDNLNLNDLYYFKNSKNS